MILQSRFFIMFSFLVLVFALGVFVYAQPILKEERHLVVIVGAGVSGFTAATSLLENNVTDLVVLEASDRVGGRVNTVDFAGVPVERGAEFIHGEQNNRVFELVSGHNLLVSYMSQLLETKRLFSDISGHQYNSTLVKTVLDEGWEIFDGNFGGFNGSVAEYVYPKLDELLKTHGVDADLGQAIRHLLNKFECSNNACNNLEEVGALGQSSYVESEGDQTWTWNSGTPGYKILFDILSKKFPDPSAELPVMEKIRFGKEVQRISQNEDSGTVTLTCADGSSYEADHVIVTVSLGVLKRRAEGMFQPALPQNKTDAIRTIGIGCVGKVLLLFPTRWWPADVNSIIPIFSKRQLEEFRQNSTHGYWSADVSGFYPMVRLDRMFEVWFSGESCRTMEKLTDEQVVDGLLELLNALVGQVYKIPRPEAILKTNWASYNYTLGAYSYCTVESDRLNVTRKHLSEPLLQGDKPVVMFAGEATNDINWSTVNGALDTGRREAIRVLEYLRSHSRD